MSPRGYVPEPYIPRHFTEEKIFQLRDMTNRMGALHEAQIDCLQTWPFGVFAHGFDKCIFRYDLDTKSISYGVELGKRRTVSKDVLRRVKWLGPWVHWLLGPEWEVRVRVARKLIYHGKRLVPVSTQKYEGNDFEAGRMVPPPWPFQTK